VGKPAPGGAKVGAEGEFMSGDDSAMLAKRKCKGF
jgi:hypothetical protein